MPNQQTLKGEPSVEVVGELWKYEVARYGCRMTTPLPRVHCEVHRYCEDSMVGGTQPDGSRRGSGEACLRNIEVDGLFHHIRS